MSVDALRAELASQWQRVRDVFLTFDHDGNGKISRAEWAVALPRALKGTSKADALALFDFFDRDRSGDIDFEEMNAQLRQGLGVELDDALKDGAVTFERNVSQRHSVRRTTGKTGSNVVDGLNLQGVGGGVGALEALRDAISNSMQRTMNLFKEWDTDNSGGIDRGEFARALGVLGLESDARVAVALFDLLDDNKDGELQFAELHAKLRRRIDVAKEKREREERARRRRPPPREHSEEALDGAAGLISQLRRELAKNLRRTMDLFRAWDTDGSGEIDKAEFGRAVRQLLPEVRADIADALFDLFDADQSGTLEFVELHAQLGKAARRGGGRTRPRAPGEVTPRMRALQDVRGRVSAASVVHAADAELGARRLAAAPPAPAMPRTLPPVPTLPMTSPARHRRVGRRMPLSARTDPSAEKAETVLPPLATDRPAHRRRALGVVAAAGGGGPGPSYAAAYMPPPGVVEAFPPIPVGFRWNWQ